MPRFLSASESASRGTRALEIFQMAGPKSSVLVSKNVLGQVQHISAARAEPKYMLGVYFMRGLQSRRAGRSTRAHSGKGGAVPDFSLPKQSAPVHEVICMPERTGRDASTLDPSNFPTVIARNVRTMRNKPAVRRRRKIKPPIEEDFPSTCPNTAASSHRG
jgi:hypothetical protein